MKNTPAKKKRTSDIIILAVLLLAAVALLLFFLHKDEGGAYVEVRIDGDIAARYSLYDNGTYPLNGGSNILVIEDGYAWISEANCPDGICVNQGRVSYTGQCITCLPNRLTVTVFGGKEGIDIMSQ